MENTEFVPISDKPVTVRKNRWQRDAISSQKLVYDMHLYKMYTKETKDVKIVELSGITDINRKLIPAKLIEMYQNDEPVLPILIIEDTPGVFKVVDGQKRVNAAIIANKQVINAGIVFSQREVQKIKKNRIRLERGGLSRVEEKE